MAKLEPNDLFQDRGVVKITDGTYILDIVDGKIIESTLDAVSSSRGDQRFLTTRDVNELFSEILVQLKIIVAQNNEVHDLNLKECDVGRN